MRINAINMLRQAADAIDPARDQGGYAYMLKGMSEVLAELRDGKITWDEFAESFCLTERDRPQGGQA